MSFFAFDFSAVPILVMFFFFFNDTATTEIYTLSLHDALPISRLHRRRHRGGYSRGAKGAHSRSNAGALRRAGVVALGHFARRLEPAGLAGDGQQLSCGLFAAAPTA